MRDSVAGTPAFMAPELFEDNTFTEKSDVYSYAVVLWEIYDRGIPWAGLKPQQILYKLIKEQRLDVPKSMPRDLSSLMERAWAQDPDARPSFADICKELGDDAASPFFDQPPLERQLAHGRRRASARQRR